MSEKNQEKKTNVMRILDSKNIEYESHFYGEGNVLSGSEVAKLLGQDESRVFKTLVTISKSKKNYVFLVPVSKNLNLKKASKSVGEKQLEMLLTKDLFPLTGYVHGGCSPIGMKKKFITIVDESANLHEKIIFSAGKVGHQVELSIKQLNDICNFSFCDVVD